jgi:aminopeptidase-like protein
LFQNRDRVNRIKHGWVLTGVGDRGGFTYKRSRRGDADVDRAFAYVFKHTGAPSTLIDFDPFGYDERQFCSPGFDLPMGCLLRTLNGRYPQYHTSADNLDFIHPQSLSDAWSICLQVIDVLEGNQRYINQQPYCEPRLAPRGLHTAFGMGGQAGEIQKAITWVLNLSDGRFSLLDIAERTGMSFGLIRKAADLLIKHELLIAASSQCSHSEQIKEAPPVERETIRCTPRESCDATIPQKLERITN